MIYRRLSPSFAHTPPEDPTLRVLLWACDHALPSSALYLATLLTRITADPAASARVLIVPPTARAAHNATTLVATFHGLLDDLLLATSASHLRPAFDPVDLPAFRPDRWLLVPSASPLHPATAAWRSPRLVAASLLDELPRSPRGAFADLDIVLEAPVSIPERAYLDELLTADPRHPSAPCIPAWWPARRRWPRRSELASYILS